MTPLKVYIAGPMTGIDEYNVPEFDRHAGLLAAHGITAFNPADLLRANPHRRYEDYLKEDLTNLLKCRAVLLLPGWEQSRGANLEYQVATHCGIPCFADIWHLVEYVREIRI